MKRLFAWVALAPVVLAPAAVLAATLSPGVAQDNAALTPELAYVSIRTGDAHIYTRGALGAEHMVTQGKGVNTQPALSGSGRLAFTSRVGAYTKVFVGDESGTGLQRLTAVEDSIENSPSWAPDGKSVAYLSLNPVTGAVDLRITDITTRATTVVSGGGKIKGPAAATWSADGKRLAFMGSPSSRSRHVWVVERDGSNLRNISEKFAQRGGGYASLSPDGSQVVWSADLRERATHIVVTTLATGATQDLTPDAVAGHESPRWSPDGKQIVFASTRDDTSGARTDIFVMNADGSRLRNLSQNKAENFDPKWSADGQRIVFASLRTGTSLLYEVGLTDGVTRPLGQHLSHDMDHATRPVALLR